MQECLQVALVPYLNKDNRLPCEKLKEEAFSTHAPCYVNSGFCKLDARDLFEVLVTVAPAFNMAAKEMIKAAMEVLRMCV